ncbi:MAG: hypothetical protein ACI37T_02315 [Candidatus Gastranaerophilaceae bacterium]
MTISKKTALLGVNDLKIFPVTKDDSTGFTTGSAIDVPGIRQISVTFDIDEKELTGDEKTLAVSSKIKSVSFTSEYAELSLDVLGALSGGKVSVASGSSSETATFSFSDGDKPSYFQLQAKIDGTDSITGGDCHICIYKAKVTAMPINGVQSDFATYTFEGKGVYTEYLFGGTSSKLIDIDFNSTAKELTAKTSA